MSNQLGPALVTKMFVLAALPRHPTMRQQCSITLTKQVRPLRPPPAAVTTTGKPHTETISTKSQLLTGYNKIELPNEL